MSAEALYRTLVPDAPLYRRTEPDLHKEWLFTARAKAGPYLIKRGAEPGLQAPQLISSYAGAIRTILLAFPSFGVGDRESAAAYQSVIRALRAGTRFIVVHHQSNADEVQGWFDQAGHGETQSDASPNA